MQKYELVISEYDSLNDCDVDKVVKLNGIENMNELTTIDNYISKYSKTEIDNQLIKENNLKFAPLKLRIKYLVGEETRYFNPIYNNDAIYSCSLITHKIKHSSKSRIDMFSSKFEEEKDKLCTLLKTKNINEIGSIFPYDSEFKKMLLYYMNTDFENNNDLLYMQKIIEEFKNYTTFRSWIAGNLNKNKGSKILFLKEVKKQIIKENPKYDNYDNSNITESERLQNLNDQFTETDNEEFLTDEEMNNAGYGIR